METRGPGYSSIYRDRSEMDQAITGLEKINIDAVTMNFTYGPAIRGPKPEFRSLDAIRPNLLDPQCNGPDPVYSIAMDVRRDEDEDDLKKRFLLFGIVAYAAGTLGREPVRSQGHVHAIAPHSDWSPPELFEIWEGTAIIYAQEFAADDPGRCIAVTAGRGEKVVVPPGWAHAVINPDTEHRLVFGAWCDREYGFEYADIRAHGGLAHFPTVVKDQTIEWVVNSRYRAMGLQQRKSRSYPELGLDSIVPIYEQYRKNPDSVEWVAQPQRFATLWRQFEP